MPTTLKSPSTTTSGVRPSVRLAPVHPGDILRETLQDLDLSANRLALAIGVPANRISAITGRRRGITGETALRLGRYFGTTANYWINMQARYDLETARDRWESRILAEVRPLNAA
jgi:antitoxin HigA-1